VWNVAQIDVDRDQLPLGDYMWLLLQQQDLQQAATAAAAAAQLDHEDGDERAAAAERALCVTAGAVVERKTLKDLVGRSVKG
jgi:ERCC4-type nuclease